MSVAVASPGSRYQPLVTAALFGSNPCPTMRPASFTPNAVRRTPPPGSVCGITPEPATLNVAACSVLPPSTEPTATSALLMPFTRPSASSAGSGSCDTVPFFQMTGSGLEPKNVVAAVPAATPRLFTPLALLKFRPARLGSPTVPPACVHSSAWFAPVIDENPETYVPLGETPAPLLVVS